MATFANYKRYLVENVIVEDCTIISGNTPYKNAFVYTEGDMKNLRFFGNKLISVNASPLSFIRAESGHVSKVEFIQNRLERRQEEQDVLDDHFAMINTENLADIQDIKYLANEVPSDFNRIYKGDPQDLDSMTIETV